MKGMPDIRYRHPKPGPWGRGLAALMNHAGWARARRKVMAHLPFIRMSSQVLNVAYMTWLVDADAAQALVPAGMPHMRLWQRNGLTPFTVLSYQHRHFGPKALGVLRPLFPSPRQSNWRLYLEGGPPHAPNASAVLFLNNVMDSLPLTLATRLFSDALPTHLAQRFEHLREGNEIHTLIAPGAGSASALEARLSIDALQPKPDLPAAFAACFANWDDAVRFLALQDGAVTRCLEPAQIAYAQIELPIDPAQVLPAHALGPVHCSLLSEQMEKEQMEKGASMPADALPAPLIAKTPPFCFVVERVAFLVTGECLLPSQCNA